MADEMQDIKVPEHNAEPEPKKTKCTLCGLCRMSCPIYKVFLNEAGGPRGKAVLLKQNHPSRHFYFCTLCRACEHSCIIKDMDLTEKVRDYRKELVELGMTTEANEKMIENIRRYGNTLGPIDESNKKRITLFCC